MNVPGGVLEMNAVNINFELCKECEYCIEFCPRKTVLKKGDHLNKKGYYPPIVTIDDCIACGICARVCPEAAIEVTKDVNE